MFPGSWVCTRTSPPEGLCDRRCLLSHRHSNHSLEWGDTTSNTTHGCQSISAARQRSHKDGEGATMRGSSSSISLLITFLPDANVLTKPSSSEQHAWLVGLQGGWETSAITHTCKVLDGQQGNAQGRRMLFAQAQTGLIWCSIVQELCGNNQSLQGGIWALWSLHAQLCLRPSCCQGRWVLQAGSGGALGQPCLHQWQWCGVLGWEREGQKSSKNQREGEGGK